MGSAPAVQLEEGELILGTAAIGLSTAPHTCGIFWAHPANAQETALLVGIPHCREGIKFAGCPAFLTQVSKRHNNKVQVLLGTLRNLPLCHQV
jgi:hypothetical protein